ncbi:MULTISPECIES: ABC transporter ATP-binding protein [Metabacillus]|uniref:ABC transporter ATP-binding protein n=2 Tax=Metabacillus TaxID=2675233 RepID=A0A179T4Y0_9BACI|nr:MULTISPECIES: ABC transporter ATP-binding protein [Metabacillus]OAS88338.1 ABC transporter ATP-binding protein [Metabacillus litoralis]QNF28065.1 ABC transporter ATP-binding protein [Metabacillus sp. KUDC1714]
MLKFSSFLKPYRISMSIALLLMLTELAVELLHPLLMAKIIDEGILQEDLSVVIRWGGVMIGISLFAFASGMINSFYAAHVSQSFGFDIRKQIFVKVQQFTFENLSRFPAASLITRMTNDITQLQNTLFMGLRIMLRAPLLVIGSVIMSFFVNPVLASVFAFVIPVVIMMLIWIMKRGSHVFNKVQSMLDNVNDVLRENLIGMRLVKAYVRREHEIKRFSLATNSLRDSTVTALRMIETSMPILLFIMNIAILFILWTGRAQVVNGNVQVGEVVAIVNYGLRITSALSMFSFIIMFLSRSHASASRISEVLETKIDIESHENVHEFKHGKVTFEHVSFTYPGTDQVVLKDISFTANAGETIAVMGGTGSGKSSLFQLLPRLYEVDSGRVYIDDISIDSINMQNLRGQIGLVPQEAVLFTGSVKENVAWGKEHASFVEIIEAAQAAQIHETIEKLPAKYETRIGQKGVNLSGGQKQRMSVARALVRKPKLLLLDDSTSALDVKTEIKLLTALRDYSCTIFLITQKVSSAREADKILLLDDGVLIAEGSHEELIKTSSLYQKIYHSQMMEELTDVKATN